MGRRRMGMERAGEVFTQLFLAAAVAICFSLDDVKMWFDSICFDCYGWQILHKKFFGWMREWQSSSSRTIEYWYFYYTEATIRWISDLQTFWIINSFILLPNIFRHLANTLQKRKPEFLHSNPLRFHFWRLCLPFHNAFLYTNTLNKQLCTPNIPR